MFRPALLLLISFTVLTGVIYPLAITGLAAVIFPAQSHGSLVTVNGKVVGSRLIGQANADPKFFWPRPSATSPDPYNAAASSGSNYGLLNPDHLKAVAARKAAFGNAPGIPADLLTASGSGLDPHISPEAAAFQAPRVAKERGMELSKVEALVAAHTEGRQLGFLGEATVNVAALNRALP